MLDQVESMYADMAKMLKRLKRPQYESNMKTFREMHGHHLEEMLSFVSAAEDKEQAAAELADVFVQKIIDAYSKRGKISGRMNVDLNFFTVFYVFPALLLTGHEDAEKVCDAICTKWAVSFKEGNISYADYNKLCSSFQTKIFGIF